MDSPLEKCHFELHSQSIQAGDRTNDNIDVDKSHKMFVFFEANTANGHMLVSEAVRRARFAY